MRIVDEDNWMLEIPEAHMAVAVRIDGAVGRRALRPYRFELDDVEKERTDLSSPSPIRRRTDIMTTRPIWAAR
jgi:hypothetical protein